MNTRKNSMMAACLTAILAFSPVASFSQATITFSGEAVALPGECTGYLAGAFRYRHASG